MMTNKSASQLHDHTEHLLKDATCVVWGALYIDKIAESTKNSQHIFTLNMKL